MNKTELAQKLDVSVTAVSNWLRQGCPHTKSKTGFYTFNLKHVRRWRTATLRPVSTAPKSPALLALRERQDKALAGMRELELGVRQGVLIEKAKVDKGLFSITRQFRDRMLSIPDRISGIVSAETDPKKVRAVLAEEFGQALADLRRNIETFA